MTDIPHYFKEALEQASANSRTMIEEGIKIGRREALLELRTFIFDDPLSSWSGLVRKIDKMLAKDAGQ